MTEDEAEEKMEELGQKVEEAFAGDVVFVLIALTDNQQHVRYVSNLNDTDSVEVMGDLMSSMSEKEIKH